MSIPLEVEPGSAVAEPEAVLAGHRIQGRSLGQIAWMRLRRDKVAIGGALLVAFLATLLSVLIGTVLGVLAGFLGGWADTLISRTMDVFLAFPLLLFAIALAGVVPDQGFGLEGNGLRVALLVFIIGFFNWPYIGRIVRGQTLSLREREFVDASRSLGARSSFIVFREVLPNLVAPILVYATLLIPTNILFEAALSFLGSMGDDDTDPDVPRRGPGTVSSLRERQAPPVLD